MSESVKVPVQIKQAILGSLTLSDDGSMMMILDSNQITASIFQQTRNGFTLGLELRPILIPVKPAEDINKDDDSEVDWDYVEEVTKDV